MTLILDITPEQEQQLALKAEQQGMDTRDYALAVLFHEEASGSDSEDALPLAGPLPPANGTGADLVAYWEREGLLGTRSDIKDSQKHARELRRKAESRSTE